MATKSTTCSENPRSIPGSTSRVTSSTSSRSRSWKGPWLPVSEGLGTRGCPPGWDPRPGRADDGRSDQRKERALRRRGRRRATARRGCACRRGPVPVAGAAAASSPEEQARTTPSGGTAEPFLRAGFLHTPGGTGEKPRLTGEFVPLPPRRPHRDLSTFIVKHGKQMTYQVAQHAVQSVRQPCDDGENGAPGGCFPPVFPQKLWRTARPPQVPTTSGKTAHPPWKASPTALQRRARQEGAATPDPRILRRPAGSVYVCEMNRARPPATGTAEPPASSRSAACGCPKLTRRNRYPPARQPRSSKALASVSGSIVAAGRSIRAARTARTGMVVRATGRGLRRKA